jgi:uncharacterized protein YjbI with pentapeptide repeats
MAAVVVFAAFEIAMLALLAFIGYRLLLPPEWYLAAHPGGTAEAFNAYRSAVGPLFSAVVQLAGGLFVGVGLYVAVGEYRAAQEQRADEAVGRAVEQLGHPHTDGRTYGINRLSALGARHFEHRQLVADVLTEFVRRRAAEKFPPDQSDGRRDLRAAIVALSRLAQDLPRGRSKMTYQPHGTPIPSWQNLNLQGIDFTSADLVGLRFVGVSLDGSSFDSAHLSGAVFDSCSLTSATFIGATLDRVVFDRIDASRARFDHARLDGAEFRNFHGREASFRQASLREALFIGGGFTRADFTGSDWENTKTQRTMLDECTFDDADMVGAHFFGDNFLFTSWNRVNLTRARFEETNATHLELVDCDTTETAFPEQSIFRQPRIRSTRSGKDLDLVRKTPSLRHRPDPPTSTESYRQHLAEAARKSRPSGTT